MRILEWLFLFLVVFPLLGVCLLIPVLNFFVFKWLIHTILFGEQEEFSL